MLSDVMEFYGLTRDFERVGYFETDHHKQIFKEIKSAIEQGKLIVLSGIVGCGKTTAIQAIKRELERENKVLVAKSQLPEKEQVKIGALMLTLFADLETDKKFKIPTQAEMRARALQALIVKRKKPVVLFIDEAHDLSSKTLKRLKLLMEMVNECNGILSVILSGHPKLKNDLRRPSMEEIGSRTSIFTLEGIQGQKENYIEWLFGKCLKKGTKRTDIFTDEAIDRLTDCLATPLQIGQHLRLAFDEAFRAGQKPVTAEIIDSVLSKDINAVEPVMTRHGYDIKAIAGLLDTKPAEIRSFLHGNLTPARTQELQHELLSIGIPL